MLRHGKYVLAVLFVVQVFNSIDGMALGLVLQDIKRDLSLSDTQLSLLTGIAFALTYSLVGVAIARWADRGNRVTIIALAMVVWSVLVAAYGLGRNILQLLLLRVGVGLGEAGCLPASQSLIADYFDRSERPRANAVYAAAGSVSCLLGYGLAGWLNQLYGWRVMFMILGLPGVAVAVLVWLTVTEPRLERLNDGGPAGSITHVRAVAPATLKEVAANLWCNTTLRCLLLFWLVWGFLGSGIGSWLATFFVRSYGLSTGELGAWLGVVSGVGGTVGALLGGAWVSRYAANDERLQLRVAAGFSSGIVILAGFMYLAPNSYLAVGSFGLFTVALNALTGPFWAMMLTLVPESMRASTVAMFMLLGGLIGNGLGSLATGALSDALQGQFAEESLRYASLALCPGFLGAAWCLWQASKSVEGDIAATQEHETEGGGRYNIKVRSEAW